MTATPDPTPRRRWRRAAGALGAAVGATLVASACIPPPASTTRISVEADGRQLDGTSLGADASADARFVAFTTEDTPVQGRTTSQVRRKDRSSGALTLISVRPDGEPFFGHNVSASVSADGSKVAFTNVVPDSTGLNDFPTVHIRDVAAGTTTQASRAASGSPASGETPALSADGRVVAFASSSPLVPGDTNNRRDVYVRDLLQGTTSRVSVDNAGGQVQTGGRQPAISADGRFVTFVTENKLSFFDTDTNEDLYVRDRQQGTTALVGLNGPGTFAGVANDISDDGRFIAFASPSSTTTQAQVWVRDRVTGELRLISRRNGTTAESNNIAIDVGISADGGHVAFSSAANDLVAGDTNGLDTFVADRTSGSVTRVSVRTDGSEVRRASQGDFVTNGGGTAIFQSEATDMVAGDTNAKTDVFVGSSRVDLQACKLEYSIVSPK